MHKPTNQAIVKKTVSQFERAGRTALFAKRAVRARTTCPTSRGRSPGGRGASPHTNRRAIGVGASAIFSLRFDRPELTVEGGK